MATDLVIQGPALEAQHAQALAAITGAVRQSSSRANSVRLHDVQRREGVAEFCEKARLDFAFVPAGRHLSDFRLLAMDMDSTLITIECIDEIADLRGIKREVAAVTASAMRGEIDFPESLRRRVALLAGLEVGALQRVYDERLRLSPGAEAMIAALKANGVQTLLVSGGFDFFTSRLQARLGLDHTLSNTLEVVDGRLTGRVLGEIVDGDVKARRLREVAASLGASREQLIAMGDGANDLPMLREAGVSVAYHAKPVVRAAAKIGRAHV